VKSYAAPRQEAEALISRMEQNAVRFIGTVKALKPKRIPSSNFKNPMVPIHKNNMMRANAFVPGALSAHRMG
jgi:hypothetical protein